MKRKEIYVQGGNSVENSIGQASGLLGLHDWEMLGKTESENDCQIWARYLALPKACQHCGCISKFYRHGTKAQVYKDMPIRHKRVGILVDRPRFRCLECNRTFLQRLPDMDEKHIMTKRLVKHIQDQARLRQNTFVRIAEDVGVDEKTVRNVFKTHWDEVQAYFKVEAPEHLCIDEVHVDRAARFIALDGDERRVIDLLPDRKKETVAEWLRGLQNKERVKVVCMDMSHYYRSAVETELPNAVIVIDKFHITRMASKSLEEVRMQVRYALRKRIKEENQDKPVRRRGRPKLGEIDDSGRNKELIDLHRKRFILLHREADLDDEDSALLKVWKNDYPLIAEAHRLKEEFLDIWKMNSRKEAEARYSDWKVSIPDDLKKPFRFVTIPMQTWNGVIWNYFDHPYTNGFTEAANNHVKTVYRQGYGYSFDTLRAKVLNRGGVHKARRPKYGIDFKHG